MANETKKKENIWFSLPIGRECFKFRKRLPKDMKQKDIGLGNTSPTHRQIFKEKYKQLGVEESNPEITYANPYMIHVEPRNVFKTLSLGPVYAII